MQADASTAITSKPRGCASYADCVGSNASIRLSHKTANKRPHSANEVIYRKGLFQQEIPMSLHSIRRGTAVTQWVVVAALIALAVVAGITLVGTRANTKLNQTATDVANPSSLKTRFGR